MAHTLRRGVRNWAAILICRAVLASCLLSGASFDARDLKNGLGQGQSAQSRLGVRPWWRLKHIPMGLDHLVPFSRAAQFKHHGGGRRGRTFRQRLVQAQEGLAARASLSCAIRFFTLTVRIEAVGVVYTSLLGVKSYD